jgi:sulfite exporter TauE/SafE
VTLQLLSGVLLVCLGLLLGMTWTIQALQPKLRRQAEERRRLNEEWSAVRMARWQRGECPRCGCPLSEWD